MHHLTGIVPLVAGVVPRITRIARDTATSASFSRPGFTFEVESHEADDKFEFFRFVEMAGFSLRYCAADGGEEEVYCNGREIVSCVGN